MLARLRSLTVQQQVDQERLKAVRVKGRYGRLPVDEAKTTQEPYVQRRSHLFLSNPLLCAM